MINCRKVQCGEHAFFRMALGLSDPAGLAEDIEYLIDFRAPRDAVQSCNRAARCLNLPMTEVGESYRNTNMPTPDALLAFYKEIVDAYRHGYAQLADIVASGASTGFGCYFGKDRTGIASYLLAVHFGVSIECAAADYCISSVELRRSIDSIPDHWTKRGLTREQYADRLECRKETILDLHSYILSSYGSVRSYLRC